MKDYTKKLVEKYIKKYKTRDPFELAKLLNIEVQLGNPGCSGCYMYLKKHRYIFLNNELDEHESYLVMAHELGHAIMHRHKNCYFIKNQTLFLTSKIELEANMFAVELLIPDDVFVENRDYTLEQLSILTGYNENLIELKMKNHI